MLKDYPKEVTLKDGEKVVLRPMEREDEQKLLEFFKGIPEEERQYLRDDVTDPTVIKKWAENLDYDHTIPLLAIIGDRIIGDATLHKKTTDKASRIGEIRIVIDKDFRRRGLGTLFAREIYYLALSRKFNKLVAEAFEEQKAVLRTCESLGFRHEKILIDRAVDLTGKKKNLIVMVEDVDALWKSIDDIIQGDVGHYSRG
jgi:RimJ/RimL family protein N-acetyltransferase